MFNISQNYQKLWKAIIRPPRAEYTAYDLDIQKKGLQIKRTDLQLTNKQGFKLVASHYQPLKRIRKDLPCLIYLHANSSCRLQGTTCISSVLCHDVTLFTFDFAGCGMSEGQYISLGYYQRDDLHCVFQYLRSLGTVSSIGIWGRSMGAVTALMYANTNPQIACLVLDSPFSNLNALCKQLAQKYASSLSTFSGIALHFVSNTIKQKHKFDIDDIDPLKHIKQAYVPAFFLSGKDDDFVNSKHTQILYNNYAGDKQILLLQGVSNHNERRDQSVLDKISAFLYWALQIKQLVKKDPQFMKENQKQVKLKYIEKQQQPEINVFQSQDHQLHLALQLSLKLQEQNKEKQKQKQNKQSK